MNWEEAIKLSLENELRKLMRKHFGLYLKLSQPNRESTKDIWEEMKLLDKKIKEIQTPAEIEEYRKYLYSFSNLIGTSEDYKYFNEYYIEKMAEIDDKYEEMKGDSTAIAIKKESKLTKLLNAIKRIFERNVSEDIQEKVTQNSINKQ